MTSGRLLSAPFSCPPQAQDVPATPRQCRVCMTQRCADQHMQTGLCFTPLTNCACRGWSFCDRVHVMASTWSCLQGQVDRTIGHQMYHAARCKHRHPAHTHQVGCFLKLAVVHSTREMPPCAETCVCFDPHHPHIRPAQRSNDTHTLASTCLISRCTSFAPGSGPASDCPTARPSPTSFWTHLPLW